MLDRKARPFAEILDETSGLNLDAHNAEMTAWDKFIGDREAAAQ